MRSDPKIVAETLLSSSILEAIPDAVAAVNQQGIIIQVNSQTEALFGYTRDEVIGQNVEILVRSGSVRGTISIVRTFTRSRRFGGWVLDWSCMAGVATDRSSRLKSA